MNAQENSKFTEQLRILDEFKKQGEQLDIEKFEEWKSSLLQELDGNYKSRVSRLEFYTQYEESFNNSDDLPF